MAYGLRNVVHHFLTLLVRWTSSWVVLPEEANKEVTAVLCDPGKRHPYLKISPEH